MVDSDKPIKLQIIQKTWMLKDSKIMDAINVKIDKENVWNTQIVLKLANSGRKQYHSVIPSFKFSPFCYG